MKTVSYPVSCKSEFCGELSCDGCEYKTNLDAYDDAWHKAHQQNPTTPYGDTIMIFDAYQKNPQPYHPADSLGKQNIIKFYPK